jgi:hypothetical protein
MCDEWGRLSGPAFRLDTHLDGSQGQPDVGVGPQGQFVVAWHSEGQDGSDYGVYARRFVGFPVERAHVVTLQSDDVAGGRDFAGYQLGSISGQVLRDLDGGGQVGINGWIVELVDPATEGVLAATVTADRDVDGDGAIDPLTESGWYSFEELTPGEYAVRQRTQTWWVQSDPEDEPHWVSLSSGEQRNDVSFANHPFGAVLVARDPVGGLVYEGTLRATLTMAGQVNYVPIRAQAGSTLAVALTNNGQWFGVDVALTLIAPSGAVLASADAGDRGDDEAIETLTLPEDGTYLIEVRSISNAGTYDVLLTLNAIDERETPRLGTNDLIQQAEDLDATMMNLSPVGRRGAVLGQAWADDQDWYSLSLTAGEAISVVAASAGGEAVTLELHDWDGVVPEVVTIPSVMIMDGPMLDPSDPAAGAAYSKLLAPNYMHLLPVGAIVVDHREAEPRIARVVEVLSSFVVRLSHYLPKGLAALDVSAPTQMTLLAVGVEDDENSAAAIHDFVAPADGTYYVRVFPETDVDYALVVTRDVAFEAEPNGALAAAQNIATAGAVLGAVQAGDGEGDFYSFGADAGAELTIRTAPTPGGPAGTGSLLDPALELYDPAGVLIASANGGGAGTSAELTHTAAAPGTYTVRVGATGATSGEYVLHVTGHNGDMPPFEVVSTSPGDGAATNELSLTVHLSAGVMPGSVDAADLRIDGAVAAAAVSLTDGNTLVFSLPADLTEGAHEMALAGGAMTDLNGRPVEPLAMQLTYDSVAPRVIASSVLADQVLPAGPLTVVIDFDEPLDVERVDEADFDLVGTLTSSHVPVTWAFGPAGSRLTLQYDHLPDDRYTLTFRSGPDTFVDPAGNALDGEAHLDTTVPSGDGVAGGDFVVSFVADTVISPVSLPLHPVGPLGSLIYETSAGGWIDGPADVDDYTIDLAAGQTVAVVASHAGFAASVQLLDASGTTVLSSASAGDVWQDAALQAVAIPAAGTYRVRIGSADGGAGTYAAEVILNAAIIGSPGGIPANGSLAAAQDLDGGFLDLTGGVFRAAVLGTLIPEDGYSVYFEDFEVGRLGSRWSTWTSHSTGSVRVVGGVSMPGGSYSLFMDREGYRTDPNLSEAIWTLDLSGISEATLRFWHAQWADAPTAFDGDFADHYDADGIAISDDGVSWHPVWNAPGGVSGRWEEHRIDLSAEAVAAGVDLDGEVSIKFQQFGHGSIYLSADTQDGRGFDRIGVFDDGLTEHWCRFSLAAGEPATVVLDGGESGGASLELYDGAGQLLAVAEETDPGGQVIRGFAPGQSGQYYLRVVGQAEAPFSLVVVRGADFDAAGNDGLADAAQDITLAGAALGSIGPGGLGWLFAYEAAVGEIVRIDPLSGAVVGSFASPLAGSVDVAMATTATTLIVAGSADEPIYELDPLTGAVLRTLPNTAGNVLAAAYADGQIYLAAELAGAGELHLEELAVEVFGGSPYDPASWYWDMPLDETFSPWIWQMSQEQFDVLLATPGHGQNYEHTGYVPGADPDSYWFVYEDQGWKGGGDEDYYDIMIKVDELGGGLVRLTIKEGAASYNFNLIRLEPEREVLLWDLKRRDGETLDVRVDAPPLPALDVLRNAYILQYNSGSLTDYDVSWLPDILTGGSAAVEDHQIWAIYPAGGVNDPPEGENWPAGSLPVLQSNQAFIGINDDAAILLTLDDPITIESWTPPEHSQQGYSRHWVMRGAGTPAHPLPNDHSPADADDEVLLHLWGRDFTQIDPRSPLEIPVPSFFVIPLDYVTGLSARPLLAAPGAGGLAAGAGQLWAVHGGQLSRIDPRADRVVEVLELPEVSGGSGAGIIAHELFIADGDRIEVYDLHTLAHRRTLSGAGWAPLEAVGADEADPGDYYRFAVNFGDELTITTATPPGGPTGLGSLLDPVLGLYDPTGRLIAVNDNGAGDGRNARIELSGAAMTGDYTVRVHGADASDGEYVLHVAGYTGAEPGFRLESAGPLTDAPPDHVVVSFSAAVLLSSLDASDLSVGGASPGGYEVLGPATIAFDVASALGGDGMYDLALAAGSVLDLRGRPVAGWSGQLLVDRVIPRVTLEPFDLAAEPHALTLSFTDDVSAALSVEDLLLRDRTAAADVAPADMSMSYAPATGEAIWTFPGLPGGRLTYGHEYRLTLPDAAVTDEAGNLLDGDGDGAAGGDCVVTFVVAGLGDVDGDGEVGYDDYATARDHFGQTGADWFDGDTDSNGVVDWRDYLAIKQQFGRAYTGLARPLPEAGQPADAGSPPEGEVHLPAASHISAPTEVAPRPLASRDAALAAGAARSDAIIPALPTSVRLARRGLAETGTPVAATRRPACARATHADAVNPLLWVRGVPAQPPALPMPAKRHARRPDRSLGVVLAAMPIVDVLAEPLSPQTAPASAG